jgi:hypothetical protein
VETAPVAAAPAVISTAATHSTTTSATTATETSTTASMSSATTETAASAATAARHEVAGNPGPSRHQSNRQQNAAFHIQTSTLSIHLSWVITE